MNSINVFHLISVPILFLLFSSIAGDVNETASTSIELQNKTLPEIPLQSKNSSPNANVTKSAAAAATQNKTLPLLLAPVPSAPATVPVDDSPLKGECSRHSDCPFNHCCTVGMMRFTFPSCAPMGRIDDPCIPNTVARNFSLSYPNLKSIQVKEAFLMFCPCRSTLVCDRMSSSCQLPMDGSPQNRYSNTNDVDEQMMGI